ncbi:hypothetical protein, partial [Acidiphilium multivorum]|uniref:hypothetical protein n=1 Tax=Acidiphilium multivorum TaxID=62140 RepID=UPI001F16EDFC
TSDPKGSESALGGCPNRNGASDAGASQDIDNSIRNGIERFAVAAGIRLICCLYVHNTLHQQKSERQE